MRSLRTIAAGLLCFLAACTNKDINAPTAPAGDLPKPFLVAPPYASPYCTYKDEATLRAAITDLYFKNQWPDPNSALSKFDQVTSALAVNDLVTARSKTRSLIGFIQDKYDHLTNPTPAQTAATNQLITDLLCFVGLTGQIFDLNPGDPAKVFTIPGVGGVWFPPNAVPVGTMVTLTNLAPLFPGSGPLLTPLDQYASYLNIELIPEKTFTPPVLPIVVVCPVEGSPLGLLLGHQDPVTGFELLEPVDFSGISELVTVCTLPVGSQARAGQNWLAHWADRAAALILPRKLQASPMMLIGGIGGSPLRFSPFAGVSTGLTGTGGLGGSPLRFVPPAQNPRPEGAPPVNPDLPAHYLSGAVGTDGDPSDPEWPTVTITTLGGDFDGQNPIADVTVTFSIGAADTFDPDSDAKVCDAQGTVQSSVSVVTDSNGVAMLPCLKFGDAAGFANLQATFDASSIGFPGDQLLRVNQNASGLSTPLNWLVKSNAGVPSALSFITSPSSTGTAGTALAQQPKLQLEDALGNEVYVADVDVTVSITVGGGSIGGTATVKTDADGVATFSGISVDGAIAGVAQTLSFGFTGITTSITSSVTVTAGAASKAVITQQPSSSATAGAAFTTQPKVTLQDQFGNTVSSTGNAVASLASGLGTLAGTTTKAAVAGVATFTDLRIDGLVGDRTLSFTLGGFTTPASNTISVGAGSATQLEITQQPSSTASAGVAFATQPIVVLKDAFGSIANSSANVTASIASGGGTLGGTATVQASAGTASFSGLSIGGTIGARTLQFTSGALPGVTSNSITVGAGPAASILTSMPPTADAATFNYPGVVTANAAISPVPRAVVKDAYGNAIVGQTVNWTGVNSTVNVGSGGSTGTGGFATVNSWTPSVGESSLLASVPGLTQPGPNPGDPPELVTVTFIATAAIPPSGSYFMCELGTTDNNFTTVGSSTGKLNLGAIRVPDAKKSVNEIFFFMSITGQSNAFTSYPVTVNVYRTANNETSPSGTPIASTPGFVSLPGNNGKPELQRITFSTPVAAGTENNKALWFEITPGPSVPTNRTFHLWYTTLASNKLSNTCKASFVKTGATSLQVGGAILLRN